MAITPEMARAELVRRRSSMGDKPSITSEMAREELERRRSLQKPKDIAGPEEEGFMDYAKRGLARGTRNAIAGGLDTLDFLATPVREGLNLGAKALGSERRFPPLGEEVAKGIDNVTGGYTAPKNKSEKTGEAIGRGSGSLLTGFGLGAAANSLRHAPKAIEATAKFLKGSNAINPTNVAATGTTSGLIQSSLNEDPENIASALGSGVAGGMAIPASAGILSLLTGKGRQAAASRTGEFFKINPNSVETFEKAGVTPMLADVSQGKIPKMLTSKLEHTPFASEPIRKAKELQRNQILEGLGQGEEGRLLSKSDIGKLAVKGTKKYQKGRQKEFGGNFDKIESDISKFPDDNIELNGTHEYFDGLLKNIKTSSQSKRFQNSPLGKMYKDLYETAKDFEGKLPYHDVKGRLDDIVDKITTQGLIGKKSQGELKKFASVLGQDIENSLEPKFKELGGNSFKNWKDSKKSYASFAQEEIPKLNELYKKDKKGAVDAFMDILQNQKKGGEKAKIALQGLSHPEQISFMESINNQLGRKSDGTFSPLVWVRKFKGLEPKSKKILLSPLNESSQKKVKYIADSIDHLKSTLEEANTSKTAYYSALGAVGTLGAQSLVKLASGNPLPAAQLAIGLFLGNKISDQLLTNPKFINWMYKGMKAKDFNHFERNLNRIPKVGKLTRTLTRSVQTFQNDLEKSKDDSKDKKNQ
jgi:hypothetical protein